MATPKTDKMPKRPKTSEIEIEPGAWQRFEKLVKSAAKMGHQAHQPAKPKAKAKRKAKTATK